MNTTTDTAMPTLSTCCYEGCDATASEYDHDGDLACPLHAAQSERYEIVADLDEGTWCNREIAARIEARLASEGWSVAIRTPRRGESLATYRRNSNGLQILGFSIPTPDVLTSAVERAWSLASQEPA